eukprot:COSAG01_NODE_75614_length_194_cov_63.526316_1_plen_40_part_10
MAVFSRDFPIPEGLQNLFHTSRMWAEFHDLCWDAVQVLRS